MVYLRVFASKLPRRIMVSNQLHSLLAMLQKHIRAIALLIGILFLAACQQLANSATYIKVFKYDGSVQCGNTGVAPDVMALELKNAGIEVFCIQQGHDGLMRTAVCGAATGNINIYSIDSADLSAAAAIGFASVDRLADYQDQECNK